MSEHDDFLARSAAFARELGAPEGTYAAVLVNGQRVPIVGTVNGPRAPLAAAKDEKLRRAREALAALERRQFSEVVIEREPEFLFGWPAIAEFAGLTVAEAQRLAERGELPVHRIGDQYAATPTGLRQWMARRRFAR